jgi:hypothetical protein
LGDKKNSYRDFVGKSEGKRPVRRHRCRWEDNIKIVLREIGWENGLDLLASGQTQEVVSCEHGNVPLSSKMLWISSVAERVEAPQGILGSMELLC